MKSLITMLLLLAGMAFGQTAPTITTQPQDEDVHVGQKAMFTVVATGAFGYQWLINGNPISGATSASYTTNPTAKGDNGAVFSVRVSNSGGSVTSAQAKLVVSPYIATSLDKGLTSITTYNPNLAGIANCDKQTCSTSFDVPAGKVDIATLTITATVTGPHSVTLNWNASTTPNVSGYYVYRTLSTGRIATVLPAATTFVDNSVGSGVTYYYVVTAFNAKGESMFSNTAQAVIPNTPTTVAAAP